jgi:hypothetical protein
MRSVEAAQAVEEKDEALATARAGLVINMSEEKIYRCEVKKLFLRNTQKTWEWVEVAVADAIQDGATQYRCKDCHGAVRLHGKHIADGPAPHVEHRSRQDSEYCPAGMYFRRQPGRESRLSATPIE